MNLHNICFRNCIVWGLRRVEFLQHNVKRRAPSFLGGITGFHLKGRHFIPFGLTLTADYYISNILENDVKHLLHRNIVNKAPDKPRLFSFN